MPRLQALIHRQSISDIAGIGEQARIADGKRDLEQRRVRTEPVGTGAAMQKIGTEFAAQIGARYDAHIDFISQLGENARGCRPDAISARLVDARPYAEICFDRARQLEQLFSFQLKRQVAGVGILVCPRFDKGRIVPGLQMGADFASSCAMRLANELVRLRRAADRVVEDEGRPNTVSSEDLLRSILVFDRADTDGTPRPVCLPVKFGFSIDDDDEHWRLLGRPVDYPPGIRVEHAS